MNLTIQISEELYRRAAQVALAENRSIEDVFASAFEQKVLELERLKSRSEKGSYERFGEIMSKIPPANPVDRDSL